MLVIGLTGGIASGKSTVSTDLKLRGFHVIDADVIARQVVEPGRKAYQLLVDSFKNDIPDLLNEDKTINRAALGRAVFGNPERLRILNRITHAAVKKEMAWQLIAQYVLGAKAVVLDVPLLFESGLNLVCGKIISVSTTDDLQLKRLLARNPELSMEDARKRIASQMSTKDRNTRSDKVVHNNGSLDELHEKVAAAVAELGVSSFWRTVDLFPPVGILMATYTVTKRAIVDYIIVRNQKKND